jgi:hypothetical protein
MNSAPPRWLPLGRTGGAQGDERLTSTVGLALIVLLGVEAATALSLSTFLPVHIFLGLLLLPAISLKLASTGWRALRYYSGDPPYRLLGPPHIAMRLLAPLLVAATIVLFASGVAFLVTDDRGGPLLTIHAVSFGVWGVVTIAHVLVYLRRALQHGLPDWRAASRSGEGATLRRSLLIGAITVGVTIALATYPVQTAWLAH